MTVGIMPHPAYVEAREGLKVLVRNRVPGEISALVGLSGMGKSEVRFAVMQSEFGDTRAWGRGRLPATMVLAAPTDVGTFNSKDFALRMLQSVQDPSLEWLGARANMEDADVIYRSNQLKIDGELWRRARRDTTEHLMLRQFVACAKARGLEILVIEQAGSMTHVRPKQRPDLHMNSLMCLCMDAGIHVVLIGVPRTCLLWLSDGEVSRRTRCVYVRRYHLERNDDVAAVKQIIATLAQSLTRAERLVIYNSLDLIFHATLGIYDELRSLLNRMVVARDAEGSTSVKRAHLEMSVHPLPRLQSMYEAARLVDVAQRPASPKDARDLFSSVLAP